MGEHQTTELFDITIIGAGPTGLFGVFYAGMRKARTKVIESLPQIGGQLTALYPEKEIYDVGGFPGILAKDLASNLKIQADRANPECVYCLGEQVTQLERLEDGTIRLGTTKGEHRTKAVILSAGIGAFEPNRLPNDDARRMEEKGVTYFVLDPSVHTDKRVLVIGGGDSAVDFALMVEPVAKQVTLIHRREGFRAHEESLHNLHESRVDVRLFRELRRIEGTDWVRGAVIFDNRTGADEELELDGIIIGTGFKAALGPIKTWGLQLQGNQIVTNTKCETNIPGVYSAGDVAWYPGKLRLIATGFGEVATAVNNAKAFYDPGSAVFPGHSSEQSAKK